MNSIEKEIPKHKRKSKKTAYKSKHKHLYKECLVHSNKYDGYFLSKYCTICGNIRELNLVTEECSSNRRFQVLLNKDEILAKYSHLELKEV